MKLRRHDVAAGDDRRETIAVRARGQQRIGVGDAIGVQEVRPSARRHPIDERMRALDHQIVPTHVRHPGSVRETAYLAG